MEAAAKDGRRPIHLACDGGHADIVQILIDKCFGMKPDETGSWKIHWACVQGNADVVKQLLLVDGLQLETATGNGLRSIHWACFGGNVEIVKLLLNAGCVIDSETETGETLLEFSTQWSGDGFKNIIEEAQRERNKDEFEIFHLKTVTVACRKYKIFDFPYAVRKIKEKVLPLNRPILFCDSIIDKSCLPAALFPVEIVSDRLEFKEYIAVDENDNHESIRSMMREMRNWEIDCSFVGFGEQLHGRKVTLGIETIKEDSSWREHTPVSFVLREEGNASEKDTVRMLFDRWLSVEKMKIAFIDSLKFLHLVDIQKENQLEKEFESLKDFVPLKRFLLVRKQLMTFYDKRNRKPNDKSSIKEIVDESGGFVSVEQKCTEQMEFIPSTTDSISSLETEETVVAVCVTEETSVTALLRKDYLSAKDIREEISKRIDKFGRIVMSHDTMEGSKIIEDDVSTAHVDDVIKYFVVSQLNQENDVKQRKLIGRGAYGEVWKCSVSGDEDKYVMKKINIPEENCDETFNDMAKEILVASRIGAHPRIMKYVRFLEDEFSFYILMHQMEMSLTGYIKKNKPLNEEKIIFFTKQILEGVDYLHDNKIIHRDIKGANILLDKSGDIKLTDFGISKCLTIASHMAGGRGANTCCGSELYEAPEVFDGHEYGLNADIWSIGATMVEMITGNIPFYGLTGSVYKKRRRDHELPCTYPSDFHDDLKALVESCLIKDPNNRPNCKTLLSNSIFKVNRV